MDFRDERERLIAEQAVLQYRAVQEAAKYGHGLEAMERAWRGPLPAVVQFVGHCPFFW
jgi:hypothetical protein